MKRILITAQMLLAFSLSYAQIENPVHWKYGIKKTGAHTYEVHLLAKIDAGWHIYAQQEPENSVATPTKIVFNTSGITLNGEVREVGKKVMYNVKSAGVTNIEYPRQVDFIQAVTVKEGVKKIAGTIDFQACTHEKCLSEETIKFNVPVR